MCSVQKMTDPKHKRDMITDKKKDIIMRLTIENSGRDMLKTYAFKTGIAFLLQKRRKEIGLTQQEVADRAGIRIQQYQKFESGERSIMTCSFKIACQVIDALQMDIANFYHVAVSLSL